MAKDEDLEKGDAVTWNSAGNEVDGRVVKRLTDETQIKGHKVKASEDNPEYLVETADGKPAAHKPSALDKQ